MKRLLLFLVLVCQMVFAPLQAGAAAQVPPRPTASIYVQDQAGSCPGIPGTPSVPTVRRWPGKPRPRSWC